MSKRASFYSPEGRLYAWPTFLGTIKKMQNQIIEFSVEIFFDRNIGSDLGSDTKQKFSIKSNFHLSEIRKLIENCEHVNHILYNNGYTNTETWIGWRMWKYRGPRKFQHLIVQTSRQCFIFSVTCPHKQNIILAVVHICILVWMWCAHWNTVLSECTVHTNLFSSHLLSIYQVFFYFFKKLGKREGKIVYFIALTFYLFASVVNSNLLFLCVVSQGVYNAIIPLLTWGAYEQ